MALRHEFAEYQFDMPDGTFRYEIIDLSLDMSPLRQIEMFRRTHGATAARPVRYW